MTAALQNGEPGKKVTTGVSNASTAMNHLLLGKKPLVATKPRRGPHPGAIPSPKNKRAGPRADSGNQRNSTATQYACPQVNHKNFRFRVPPKSKFFRQIAFSHTKYPL